VQQQEWNKSLRKSREYASYEKMQEFLTVYIRGLSDTTKVPDTGFVKARVRSRAVLLLIAYRFPASIMPDLTIWLYVKIFSQSQSCNILRLLRRSKFASIACGRITSKCPSRSRCAHCHHIHHSLLQRTAVIAETPVDRKLEVDDSSRMISHASSTGVTNVQNVQAEVAPVGVLLATASVDPYPSESQCFQIWALLDQGSTLSFISSVSAPRTKR